jgi:ArsR family transcriptional regulator, virulence genes transcriptional regulator
MSSDLRGNSSVQRMQPELAAVRGHVAEAAGFLKALANDQRLLVLCSLLGGRLSVGEINERVHLSQSALSQHLSVLREAGLVTTTREAQTIYYTLTPGPAVQVMEVLYSAFCEPGTPRRESAQPKCRTKRRV